jgi:hypothetical protein
MRNAFFPRRRLLAACAIALFAGALARLPASADQAPIKIAMFNFELKDFSGGAGIAGDPAADLKHLDDVTSVALQLIAGSGRYALVDVSGAEGEDVKDRTLRECHGCEAAIAEKLGADQSFLGIVTRITRTDYVVSFLIRDAHTGAVILARTSDLRIGADYSWDRGARALIRDHLLDGS